MVVSLDDASVYVGRALVIDDAVDTLELMSRLMPTRLNCRADSAGSVSEARELLLNNTYDIIICDYQIGSETGADFLLFLIQEKIELPFFFFTGHRELHARDFHDMDYPLVVIHKPNYDALLKGISEVMHWSLRAV